MDGQLLHQMMQERRNNSSLQSIIYFLCQFIDMQQLDSPDTKVKQIKFHYRDNTSR